MTKSTSRSQVRLIASTNAIFGADEACAMLRISRDAMYRLAKDPDDPFPIRYIGGKTRDGIVLHDEARRMGRAQQRRRLAKKGLAPWRPQARGGATAPPRASSRRYGTS